MTEFRGIGKQPARNLILSVVMLNVFLFFIAAVYRVVSNLFPRLLAESFFNFASIYFLSVIPVSEIPVWGKLPGSLIPADLHLSAWSIRPFSCLPTEIPAGIVFHSDNYQKYVSPVLGSSYLSVCLSSWPILYSLVIFQKCYSFSDKRIYRLKPEYPDL